MQYLKNRLSERSTWFGVAGVLLAIPCLLFPEWTSVIVQVAAALGVTVAAVPTGGGRS